MNKQQKKESREEEKNMNSIDLNWSDKKQQKEITNKNHSNKNRTSFFT